MTLTTTTKWTHSPRPRLRRMPAPIATSVKRYHRSWITLRRCIAGLALLVVLTVAGAILAPTGLSSIAVGLAVASITAIGLAAVVAGMVAESGSDAGVMTSWSCNSEPMIERELIQRIAAAQQDMTAPHGGGREL